MGGIRESVDSEEAALDHVRAKGLQARMLYNGSERATVAEE